MKSLKNIRFLCIELSHLSYVNCLNPSGASFPKPAGMLMRKRCSWRTSLVETNALDVAAVVDGSDCHLSVYGTSVKLKIILGQATVSKVGEAAKEMQETKLR